MANGFNNDDFNADGAISGAQLNVDNIRIDGNTISSTNTNGDINLTPNGTGNTIINGASFTELNVDNLNLNGNTLSSTDTNGDVIIAPDGSGSIQLLDTDAGAGVGPMLELYRNSASPANSDVIGGIDINGKNSAAADYTYINHFHQIETVTSGSEDGRYVLQVSDGGALRNAIDVRAGATNIYGTIDGTSVPAGALRQIIIDTESTGVTLTNNTFTEIASITLTPGVWEIVGKSSFSASGSNTGNSQWLTILSTSTASITTIDGLGADGLCYIDFGSVLPVSGNNGLMFNSGPVQVNITSNTTYYLNVRGFTTGDFNVNGFGTIKGTRVG